MSDIDMNLLAPQMTAELWREVAKLVPPTSEVAPPLVFFSDVERVAFAAAANAVATWVRMRTVLAAIQKDLA